MALRTATAEAGSETRAKRKRSVSQPRPAYFIIQINDESGQPMSFDKSRVKLVKVERDAEKVWELTDSGEYQHAITLRGLVPVARQQRPQSG